MVFAFILLICPGYLLSWKLAGWILFRPRERVEMEDARLRLHLSCKVCLVDC